MAERPIIMSGESVRAILAGRKSVTRRVVKPQPAFGCRYVMNGDGNKALHCADTPGFVPVPVKPTTTDHRLPCRQGAPGDLLWVRETWASPSKGIVAYRSTGECGAWNLGAERFWIHHGWLIDGGAPEPPGDGRSIRSFGLAKYGGRWHSPMMMPRWASRLTLRVKSVRVERLHEITEEDARAEGVDYVPADAALDWTNRDEFARGWDRFNGKRAPWASNPWVWRIEFLRVTSELAS